MKPNHFSYSYKISPSDLDELNHLNNMRYIELILTAAKQHWESLASAELKTTYAWFLVEHHLKYKAQGFSGDELKIVTWVEETTAMKSTRITQIFRDKTLLVTSKTTWCLVTKANKKITRISEELKGLFM